MKQLAMPFLLRVSLFFAAAGAATAANPHTGGMKGQPNQSCQNPGTMSTPGNAVSARGSPFNSSGISGTKYAGTQPQNTKTHTHNIVAAQYDVACFQMSQPGHP
jgi:hypothetical protein